MRWQICHQRFGKFSDDIEHIFNFAEVKKISIYLAYTIALAASLFRKASSKLRVPG
jgi:hypothetical protein